MRLISSMPVLAIAAMVSAHAGAQTITEGFTYSVANGGGGSAGDHFHSSTAGFFGNPAGKAEIGGFFGEEVRGLSEYNLAGLSSSSSAFVTFNLFNEGGLFGQGPFTGVINVLAYVGDNTEDLADFQVATVATIGSFSVSPATADAGDVFSFDVTSTYNSLIGGGAASLGIRLQAASPVPDNQAWTFDRFRLTSDDQSTGAVPEPATWATMIIGFGMAGGALRSARRRRKDGPAAA